MAFANTNLGTEIALLNNASATGNAFYWPGGAGMFDVKATWGGGTVKLQYLGPDNTTYIDAGSNTTLTADGGGVFEIGPGMIRANVATATAVYARVRGVAL